MHVINLSTTSHVGKDEKDVVLVCVIVCVCVCGLDPHDSPQENAALGHHDSHTCMAVSLYIYIYNLRFYL